MPRAIITHNDVTKIVLYDADDTFDVFKQKCISKFAELKDFRVCLNCHLFPEVDNTHEFDKDDTLILFEKDAPPDQAETVETDDGVPVVAEVVPEEGVADDDIPIVEVEIVDSGAGRDSTAKAPFYDESSATKAKEYAKVLVELSVFSSEELALQAIVDGMSGHSPCAHTDAMKAIVKKSGFDSREEPRRQWWRKNRRNRGDRADIGSDAVYIGHVLGMR